MLPATRRVLKALLKGRQFRVGIDLGCGDGLAGRLLKRHVEFLVGVDHSPHRLRLAGMRGHYNELVLSEIQDFEIPTGVDAAFLLDSLEHLPKTDGYHLLQRLNYVPFILITTPETWHEFAWRNRHQSLWTEQELQQLGFATMTYDLGLIGAMFGSRKAILAVKGVRNALRKERLQ